MTIQRWPGAPTSPLVAAWPVELPHLQFQIHGSPDGVAAVHLLKVCASHLRVSHLEHEHWQDIFFHLHHLIVPS